MTDDDLIRRARAHQGILDEMDDKDRLIVELADRIEELEVEVEELRWGNYYESMGPDF